MSTVNYPLPAEPGPTIPALATEGTGWIGRGAPCLIGDSGTEQSWYSGSRRNP
ncbi:hypothetical protein SB659_16805 [Arthrobacter sp. SIMBA_036]|uniref:hypothetical protein n=1 Tax=Arthrobacter sp. SIMBA_036 TaxID=3085778 RepID=UPI00397E196A